MTHSVPTNTPVAGRAVTTLLALFLPLALLLMAAAITWTWRAELPHPLATHWGAHGVDGFGSLTGSIAAALGFGTALTTAFWALGFWWGRSASVRRIGNGTAVWCAVLLGGILVATTDAQRGLADARDVQDVGGRIAGVLACATVAGLLVAFLTPGDASAPVTQGPPSGAARIELGEGERAVWFERVSSMPVVVGAGIAAIASAVAVILARQPWLLIVPVLLVVLLASMFSWTVRVSPTGVRIASALRFPRAELAIDEIVSADVVEVRALREFGGWGWRVGRGGRTGVIVRSGEALQITQSNGRVFVVTVDDAARGAALLNTFAHRSRSPR